MRQLRHIQLKLQLADLETLLRVYGRRAERLFAEAMTTGATTEGTHLIKQGRADYIQEMKLIERVKTAINNGTTSKEPGCINQKTYVGRC